MITFEDALAQAGNLSILGPPKLTVMYKYLAMASALSGDAAELGVYKGGTAKLIALCLPDRTVHLFDTFVGLPQENAAIDIHVEGQFGDTDLETVQASLTQCSNARFFPGLFPDTIQSYHEESRYCFVHVDLDYYQGTAEALAFFYPRMTQGGIMIFDDYLWPHCPGVQVALEEFLADKSEQLSVEQEFQAILVKQ